jgi:hypothetical protein
VIIFFGFKFLNFFSFPREGKSLLITSVSGRVRRGKVGVDEVCCNSYVWIVPVPRLDGLDQVPVFVLKF